MITKFKEILCLANCHGCPFISEVAGQKVCSLHAKGDPRILPHIEKPDDPDVINCERRNSEVILQLKTDHVKMGVGFLMTPMENEKPQGGEDHEGDLMVQLIGANGVLYEGALSKLMPKETFTVLKTWRIFDAKGEDHTNKIMLTALEKAFDETPATKDVYRSLLKK